jgi:orotidine-5'-phosphate decarboxylase
MRNPILLALDVPSPEAALKLAKDTSSFVGGFKIGSELFTSAGPEIVRRLRGLGATVFVDLKFLDIPNTVARGVAALTRLDVQMLTLHTCGGSEMMKRAEEAAQKTAKENQKPVPLILGVTVLTSMDSRTLAEIGCHSDVGKQVENLASLAMASGLRGLVCSPLELAGLRSLVTPGTALVTPGIRTTVEANDDQKRTLTARQAMDAGATWLVVGRPIYAAKNPRSAAEAILATLQP